MIRRAAPSDHAWITGLSAVVYGDLGDYREIIPAWLSHPGVLSYVDTDETSPPNRRGFIILGFYELAEQTQTRHVADLLAIAVEPDYQRQGVGRRLLRFAIRLAQAARSPETVTEIRLTVPETNAVGRHLYTSTGFEVLDEDHGAYDGGQRAIRMSKRLEAAS